MSETRLVGRGSRGDRGPRGPTGPAGSGGGSGGILWAPGGGGDATTWAEVMAFVAASAAPIVIYVSVPASAPPATIPPGSYSLNSAQIVSLPPGIIEPFDVAMEDGAQLVNLGGLCGINLTSSATSVTPLVFDTSPPGAINTLQLSYGGNLDYAGTIPMIQLGAGGQLTIAASFKGGFATANPSGPIANLGDATSILVIGGAGVVTGINSGFSDGFVTGVAGSRLIWVNFFGNVPAPLPNNPGFFGTTSQFLPVGSYCTGPATRPSNPFGGDLTLGSTIFDQSIGKPIWWNGTTWVDATGTPA